MRDIPIALSLGAFLWSLGAQAQLQVFPTKVFLGNNRRVTQLTLRHLGAKPETYRISAIFYRMSPDGKLTEVADPQAGERSLRSSLRFSPRSVTLAPRLEQTVRVMVIPSGELAEGEYRAHIKFEPDGTTEIDSPAAGGKVAMKLTARMAIAVPVFFKQGNPSLDVSLSALKLVKSAGGKPAFEAELESKGGRVAYGDFKAWFTPQGKSEPELVGLVKGASSYLPKRKISFELTPPEGLSLARGSLRLEFFEVAEEGGRQLASVEAPLQ